MDFKTLLKLFIHIYITLLPSQIIINCIVLAIH